MATTAKTILVTGATGGIGLVVCNRLAIRATRSVSRPESAKLRALTKELSKAYPAAHAWLSVDMPRTLQLKSSGES